MGGEGLRSGMYDQCNAWSATAEVLRVGLEAMERETWGEAIEWVVVCPVCGDDGGMWLLICCLP